MIADRRVVVGVSGGIAVYKACTIARRLTELGAAVDVVMTASATEFVRPTTFEALTHRAVATSLWERGRALDHIHLARDADLIVLAPATAHLLARAALGLADDLLSTMLVAAAAPVLVVPAMNDSMFAHPATRENLRTLERRGWKIIGPDVGALAEGPSERPGRMVEPDVVVAHAVRMLRSPQSALRDRRVVVTAGPTREPLDEVRVLTNRSSGRMGFAVARAAFLRGADVVLIAGPTTLPPPEGVEVVAVESTADLEEAVAAHITDAAALVMAAAPSDYRPRDVAEGKRPRQAGALDIVLDATADVLQRTIPYRPSGCVVVGFALEQSMDVARAREKLAAKQLNLVVLNSASDPQGGFEVETNRVALVTRESSRDLPLLSKAEVAEQILDEVEARL